MTTEDFLKEQIDKFSVRQRCPRCGKDSLKISSDKMICSECGYQQDFKVIK